MEFYSWWLGGVEEIMGSPDKLKLIRVLVRQECQLREILGYQRLKQDQINKLVALLELKFLLHQKKGGDGVNESLKKCNDEINRIREAKCEIMEVFDGEIEECEENNKIREILADNSYVNPIIGKIMS